MIVERATSNALRQERARGEEAGGLLSAISGPTDKQNKTADKNKVARHHMPPSPEISGTGITNQSGQALHSLFTLL